MIKRRRLAGVVAATMVVAAAMSLPAIASAHEGEFARFDQCPSTNEEVTRCVYSEVEGGEVTLGNKTVPIVNPVTLQGGYGQRNAETGFNPFFGATNGETLSKSPQPVPGGLAGLLNCQEISEPFLRGICEAFFENGITGVNSTVELARPANEIKISEFGLVFGSGTALQLPVKVHLENPLLGDSCYIGSSSSPIIWNLTAGTTSPPPPNEPISGKRGSAEAIEEGLILKVSGSKLVDNAWSAPGSHGCGGPLFESLLDPILNVSVGVPSPAGHNTAIQEVTTYVANPGAVNSH